MDKTLLVGSKNPIDVLKATPNKTTMKEDILIYPREYSLLLDEIRLKGSAYRKDRSGKLSELIFDLDGVPHRRDQSRIYLKWKIGSLDDLNLVISFMNRKIETPYSCSIEHNNA